MKKIYVALVIGVLLTGCSTPSMDDTHRQPAPSQEPVPQEPKTDVPGQDTLQVTVYRPDQNAMQLVKETATIAKMESDSKRAAVMFGLLKQSNPETHTLAPVPPQVELLSATIENGTLILNFNEAATHVQGSTGETMFVDALNKTMFDSFANVTKIKYQINGKDADVLNQLVVKDGFTRP